MATRTVYSVYEGKKFAADQNLHVVSCATCKMLYAIPESLYQSANKYPGDAARGWKLFCPLGHEWWYVGKSVEDKLQEERDRAAQLYARLDQERAGHNSTRRSLAAQKGVTTRLKRRTAAGVCPCCNRTFQNLGRHMAGQHPDFTKPKADS